ncbi:MAG: NAD(P)/FAD-dependent oxidoreductase [Pseudomonadota bacterium]
MALDRLSEEKANGRFDVAVIGGGVVGCAAARRFALEGARTVLIERAPDILAGASKGNSALLHTGFDATPGSLELVCVRAGYAEYLESRERLGLPLLEAGAAVVAWTEEELARLDGIVEQAHRNGVMDVHRIDRAELLAREPQLSPAALGAVLVPGEHVIDPWSAPLAYLTQAVENGAEALFSCPVERGEFDGASWSLATPRGRIEASVVVNCAGLWGDLLDRALLGVEDFTIRPRKGQFVVFDKAAAKLLRTILLPVPSERTKGVVLARTVFGNLLVGPTAEEQEDRERAATDGPTLARLVEHARRLVPALAGMPVTAAYAGLRPATESKDYRIVARPERNWITVGGIRSTGLTAALGIARHVWSLYEGLERRHEPLRHPVWPRLPNLAEHAPRDHQSPGYGEIVCHCELVTRREIEAALGGSLPAGDLGGLKRRTRAMMGRCQGFYCAARVAAIAHERWGRDRLQVEALHGR